MEVRCAGPKEFVRDKFIELNDGRRGKVAVVVAKMNSVGRVGAISVLITRITNFAFFKFRADLANRVLLGLF